MNPEIIRLIAVGAPALLLSLSVHEFAHAFIATRLGDPTPERQGRLTLSPLSHIDIFGTLVFPALLAIMHAPIFGWAKPVQFSPVNFTRRVTMWQGAALTAFAGPLSNILLALLSAVGLRVMLSAGFDNQFAIDLFSTMFNLNILLAVFNLFPLPPLDGGHLIPERWANVKNFLTRYSLILFVGLFFLPIPGIGSLGFLVIGPVMSSLSSLLRWMVGLS